MAVAFSSSGDEVMTRHVEACSDASFRDITEEFDILSTATWIQEHSFSRVCRTLVQGRIWGAEGPGPRPPTNRGPLPKPFQFYFSLTIDTYENMAT